MSKRKTTYHPARATHRRYAGEHQCDVTLGMQRRAKKDFERYAQMTWLPAGLRRLAQQCAEEVKIK